MRLLGGFLVNADHPQHVEVNVQAQRAAEALDQHHRAALRPAAINTGLIGQPAGDHALHDRQHRTDGIRFTDQEEALRVRETQVPLPHWPRAEHLLNQMTRTLSHTASAAAGAETALLAGERHQPLGVAVLAHHPQEAMFEHPAAKVVLELLADILRQREVRRFDACYEIRVVRLDPRAQQRARGCVAGAARNTGRGRGLLHL